MNRDDVISNHYRTNYSSLVKRIQRRVPNNSVALAEEVVQEAYSRALHYWSTFEPKKSSFDKWFSGILRNATKDCRMTEGSKGTVKDYDENDVVITTFDDYKHSQIILAEIHKTQDISLRDWNILRMFFILGFTSKDIAIFLDITHSNVRQIIFKFKQRINESE